MAILGEKASKNVSKGYRAGLVPAIVVFDTLPKTWMPGTRPGMTVN
jgi:hypothetical protein